MADCSLPDKTLPAESLSVGVILALISSLAISLTLIAALAARVLGRRAEPRRGGNLWNLTWTSCAAWGWRCAA